MVLSLLHLAKTPKHILKISPDFFCLNSTTEDQPKLSPRKRASFKGIRKSQIAPTPVVEFPLLNSKRKRTQKYSIIKYTHTDLSNRVQ